MKRNSSLWTALILVLASITLSSASCTKEPILDREPPSISSFNGTATTSSITLNASATDNVGAVRIDIIMNGQRIGSINGPSGSFIVNGLHENTEYRFQAIAYDAMNLQSFAAGLTMPTLEIPRPKSTWFSAPTVVYGAQFAMIGNTVSSELSFSINNPTASAKTISLIASFGTNGEAVKSLRYKQNAGNWVTIPENAGKVNFADLALSPGVNTFECRYATDATMSVANGASLSFEFVELIEESGKTLPIEGKFNPAVPVGSVNTATQATRLTTNLKGELGNAGSSIPPLGGGLGRIFTILNVRATGPANARFGELRVKNPYASFNTLTFSGWQTSLNGAPEINIPQHSWQNEYVTLTLPKENSIIVNRTTGWNSCIIDVDLRNIGTTTFYSHLYTPYAFGLMLTSKYDVKIYNSDDQLIDLSDVTVYQDDVILTH